jgi:hypothetical protein
MRKWMKVLGAGPASQEVDTPPAQLARAGSGQEEAEAACLDRPVVLIEKLRETLDLADDNYAVIGCRLLPPADPGRG